MKKLMIIEDSNTIREELKALLNRYGYEVFASDKFENIINDVEHEKPHLILLDINLPIYDRFYICREIRKISNIPIIIVTSRDNEVDELMSINLGAYDFVTKPYNTQILLARISSVLKRVYNDSENMDILEYKDLSLNLSKGTVKSSIGSLEISKNDINILSYLIKNKEKTDLYVDDNTLSVNINRLRKKLEEIGLKDYIETRRGLVYIMK